MKRVLLVNNGYPDDENKNNCTYIKSIHDCLKEANYDVDVLTLKSRGNKKIRYIKFYLNILFKNIKKYDVLYINHWPFVFLPFIFKRKKKKEIIINFHGSDLLGESKIKKIINKISIKFIHNKAKIIVPSGYFKKESERILNNEVFVVPSGGIDKNIFFKCKKENGEKIKFGYASGLNRAKGMDMIINSFLELIKEGRDNISLVIIDYGADKEDYKRIIKDSGLESIIEYDSIYDKEDMWKFYNRIDCLLFPTIRKSESLGLVALEALACSNIVIGTNDFAVPEFIKDGVNGFLFSKNNSEELLNSIKKVINKEYDINNYYKYSSDLIEKKYSKERCIELYKEIIK